jgi:hypothetical protein
MSLTSLFSGRGFLSFCDFSGFFLKDRILLDIVQAAARRGVMSTTNAIRLLTAMLVTVAVIGLSTIATQAPAQNQNSLTLKSIRTDNTAVFYADNRPACAWFVEAVYADHRPTCAWFVEAVLPTGDSNVATENLKSVAALL